MTKSKKAEIVTKYGRTPKDSGNAAVQVALCTERIRTISEHMQAHRKDYATQLGLLRLVSQRRSLLEYLKRTDFAEYSKTLKTLDLRK